MNPVDAEFGTLSDLLRHHALMRPAAHALVCEGEVLDFATLDAWVDRAAAAMQRDGLKHADTIAICATNSLQYVIAFLGGLRAGLAVAPLAPDMAPAVLATMLEDAVAKRLFVDAAVAAAAPAGIPRVTLDGSAGGQPWSEWIASAQAKPQGVEVRPDDVFNIIYSSGTTGTPKGIVLPHAFRWAQFKLFSTLGYGTDSVILVSLPLYSNMTLSGFLPPLAMGSTSVLMKKFDARRFLELVERHRVTHAMLVPIQYQRMLAVDGFDKHDLSSLKFSSCGSARFPEGSKREVLQRWPGELIEYYGMTEGCGVCMLDLRRNPTKLNTVGRPLAGHDMRVIDEEGRELPVGSVGEVVGRCPTMMLGYHNQPAKTREVEWFDGEGNRFIRSGDVGAFDADGFLVLMDRTKDMLISGGFNVYPSDVEAVLREHPEVADVAVTGVPSEQWGESPVAFVIRRAGSALLEAELLEWSRPRLNKAQRLLAVEFVEDLPRNGIGKVLKRTLRSQWLARPA